MTGIPDTRVVSSERRSFLNRFSAGAAAVAGLVLGRTAQAQTAARFEAARHDPDNWMEMPGKHRFLLDTHAQEGVGNALLWGANYIRTHQSAYGVQASD